MAVDLSFGVQAVEDLMTDVVEITDVGDGRADDTFNPTTMVWTDPTTATVLYGPGDEDGTPGVGYGEGKALIKDAASAAIGRESAEGDAPVVLARWVVKIPLEAPIPPRGSMVRVVSSRDTQLVDQRMRVVDYGGGTLKVARLLVCQEIARTIPEGDR